MLDWLQQDPRGFALFMLYRAPAILIALTLHEVAHGYAAFRAGDPTARNLGRLSLNPLKHLDLWGTVSMFLMGVGWAKPVPVNPNNFRNRRRDDLAVSLAGVATNLCLFLLSLLLTVLVGRFLYTPEAIAYAGHRDILGFDGQLFAMQLYPQYAGMLGPAITSPVLLHVQRFLFQFQMVNLGLGLFNLLPLPPLDGFHVLNETLFGGRLNMNGKVFRYAQLALILLLVFGRSFGNVGGYFGIAIAWVQARALDLVLLLPGMG